MTLFSFLHKKEKKEETRPESPTATVVAVATQPSKKTAPSDIDQIRHELCLIADALRMLNEDSAIDDPAVDITIDDLFSLMPHLFSEKDIDPVERNKKVAIHIDDLFDQLAKGKVTTTLSRIVTGIPINFLSPYLETHANEIIILPLHLVVASLRPEQLQSKTTSKKKDRGENYLPDLFNTQLPSSPLQEPEPKTQKPLAPAPEEPPPTLELVIEKTESAPAPTSKIVEEKTESIAASTPADSVEKEKPIVVQINTTPPVETNQEGLLLVKGIDVNQASAEMLTSRLDGIGPTMARQIVKEREENGPFKDTYDMALRCRMRPNTFVRATGLPWPKVCYRHRELLAKLVEGLNQSIPDIRAIASRFKEIADVEDCIIIHQDGLVLAGNENHEVLGAHTPQIFKKLKHYAKQMSWNDTPSITFYMEDKIVTLAHHGVIFLAVVHYANRFSRRQLEEVQALAFELGQRYTIAA